MAPNQHELQAFLEQDLDEMRSEYLRIRARSTEDPGTAGDEGEEAWAAVLRDWLPTNYQIRLKGRILASDGAAGPQVDIVVLRPGYPSRLVDKKVYLAGGVAAVFECKNTLTAADISKTWTNVRKVNVLSGRPVDGSSPFEELVPEIYYGLLAHSHIWTRPNSRPIEIVVSKLHQLLENTDRMRDALSLICVADLGSWDVLRMSYDGPGLMPPDLWEARKELIGATDDSPTAQIQYNMASSNVATYEPSNPLGVLISNIIGRFAFSDANLRPLSQYFAASGMGGQMGLPVVNRTYPLNSQLSESVRARIPYSLTNGHPGSEWALGFNF